VTGHDGLETEVTDTDPAFAGTVTSPGPSPTTGDRDHAPSGGGGGSLARTGQDILRLVILGLILIAAGLALRAAVRAHRRGRRPTPPRVDDAV
jgi:hypothetical protein